MELTYKQTMSRVGLCYFLLLFLTFILQSVFSAVLMALAPQVFDTGWGMWVVSYVPMYGIAVPIFFLLMAKLLPTRAQAPQSEEKMSIGHIALLVPVALGITYAINIPATLLLTLLGSDPNVLGAIQQASSLWMNVLMACIVAPVGEEFIFRKVLHDKIGQYGDKCYILISSLCFGLFHANLAQALYAFVLGMLLAYVYLKTGNIIYNIALHIGINLCGFVLIPLLLTTEIGVNLSLPLMGAFIICAIVFLVRSWRKSVLQPPVAELPEKPARSAISNVGMLCYTIFCALMIVLVIINGILVA